MPNLVIFSHIVEVAFAMNTIIVDVLQIVKKKYKVDCNCKVLLVIVGERGSVW